MPDVAPSIDVTDRDFDSMFLRLQKLVKSVFPTWTDFSAANFGVVELKLFCFVLDVLGFYQENQAAEAFIPTATQRRNLLNLAKLVGYQPPGASAAQTTVVVAFASPLQASTIIAAGRTVRTAEVTEPVVFQVLSDATALAGDTQVSLLVEHSTSHEETFASTNLANQEITLGATPFLDDGLYVEAGNGVYTVADDNNFLNSTQNSRHYTLSVDNNDRATIRYGNGTNGASPFGTITVRWKTGGGLAGNVEAEAIKKFDGELFDTQGNSVQIASVINAEQANGGDNRASNEQIRLMTPRVIRVQNRTVSREDYEINAMRVAGVARALMVTSNENAGVAENTGHLYVVPKGGGLPSSGLKAAVLEMVTVTYPNTLTFQVFVLDPLYLAFNFGMTIYRAKRATKAQVGAAIRAELATFFAISNSDGTPNTRIDFGLNYTNTEGTPDGRIPIDHVFNAVRDLSVIRRMGDQDADFLVNGLRRDIVVATNNFPTLGTMTIIDGDDGGFL
jgi:hypothetical protein